MALTDGLQLAINFNEDVLDKSGNGRDGTVEGMTYDTTTPIAGSGTGVFDGINDRVSIDVASSPQSDILDLTTGQIAFWFRKPSPIDEFAILFGTAQGLAFPSGDEYSIAFRGNAAGDFINVVCINGGSIIMSASTNTTPISDSDPHLVVVKANAVGNLIIKIDDVTQGLISSPLAAKFLGHAVNSNNMNIGALERNAVQYLGSKDIDAFYIWDRVLSNAEDTELYNGGVPIELDATAGVRAKTLMMMGM